MGNERPELKSRQIFLNIPEWETLGEQVGMQSRSAWIRTAIHKKVSLPDEDKALALEEEKHKKILNAIQTKRADIFKKQEESRKVIKDGMTALETAFNECIELQQHHLINGKSLKENWYEVGEDVIAEQAELYNIDKQELREKIRAETDLHLIKQQKIGKPIETGKTGAEYNK